MTAKTTKTTCPAHVRILVGYYVGALRKKANPNQNPTVTGIYRPKTRTDHVCDDQRVWSALDVLDLTLIRRIDNSLSGPRRALNDRWRGKTKAALWLDDDHPISDEALARLSNGSKVDIVGLICNAIEELIDEGRIPKFD